MATGTVNWFNPAKGYGFIQPQGGGNRSHRKGHVFRGWRLLARVGETNRLARVATIKIAHYRVGRRRPIRQQNEGDSP